MSKNKLLNSIPLIIGLALLYQGVHQIISHSKNAAAGTDCAVVKGSIHDGDTMRVNCQGQHTKIRFACIDAPELKQPMGEASRNYLRSLLNRAGNQVKINAVDKDRYGRTIAEVYANGQLVQLQQIKDGWAWANGKYKSDCPSWGAIEKAEQIARSQKIGIWASNPIPPWDFRRRNR